MTTFPIKEFSEMPSNEQIAKVLKNAGAQRMELSGAYLCDSIEENKKGAGNQSHPPE